MVLVYIFDLDDTLYTQDALSDVTIYENDDYIEKYYEQYQLDHKLDILLSKIDAPKYIMTNATYEHAYNVLKRLGIMENFKQIFSRDNMLTMKPSIESYNFVKNAVEKNERLEANELNYIFFDDLKENLKTAKYVNWTTCHINNQFYNDMKNSKENSPEKQKDDYYLYTDYSFSSIYIALNYFININDYVMNNINVQYF